MTIWLLGGLTCVFTYMAYDAWRLTVPWRDVPYSLTAKGIGQEISNVPLSEQESRKNWNVRYGTGDLNQSVWLWGILALACAIGTVLKLLE